MDAVTRRARHVALSLLCVERAQTQGLDTRGRLAGAAVAVGGLAMLPIDAAGLYLRKLAASDIPLDQQVSLVDGVERSPVLLVLETVHVAGLFLGLLVVGGAMLRHRHLPRWAGALVQVGMVGMVGMVAAPGRLPLAVAAALLVTGLGVAAVRVGRLAEDELLLAARPLETA